MTAPVQAEGAAESSAASGPDLARVLQAIEALAGRVGDLEDAVAEAVEELGKVRRSVSELSHKAATRKQIKKVKKVLDQLEVIDVGPETQTPTNG